MKKGRLIEFNLAAQQKLIKGVNVLGDAVKVTLGPKGRNVVIGRRGDTPHITKDGVTVAKEVYLNDPIENMGAQILRQAAQETGNVAGDGTTTSTILAQEIVNKGFDALRRNPTLNPIELYEGMVNAKNKIIKELDNFKTDIKTIKDIINIATISTNNDAELGELIGNTVGKMGTDGVIEVEEWESYKTEVQEIEGFEVDRGYITEHFINSEDGSCVVLENVKILIYNEDIDYAADIAHILEEAAVRGVDLLIVAKTVGNEALKTLVLNVVHKNMPICAIKSPGYGELRQPMLEDMAILTGTKVINPYKGESLKQISLDDLGDADKVIIRKNSTTIIGAQGDKKKIENRKKSLQRSLKSSEAFGEKYLRIRLARLTGKGAIIYVGGATEVEVRERKDRIDDALNATRAALADGIIAGGGVVLNHISSLIPISKNNPIITDKRIGEEILYRAITKPMELILKNSGLGDFEVTPELEKLGIKAWEGGMNPKENKVCNFIEAGIIDPVLVTKTALENAVSCAGMLLTTECVIIDTAEDLDVRRTLL